jgi:hypothetical protein
VTALTGITDEMVAGQRIDEAVVSAFVKDAVIVIAHNAGFDRKFAERSDAFAMADQVLYSGVACITDLMVKEGLINLDFADVRAVMREMGKAMMGTGDKRALRSAEAPISNPLMDDVRAECWFLLLAARTSLCTRLTKRPPASARTSMRTPTTSSARPSTKVTTASSGSRWWLPESASTRPTMSA